MREYLDPPLLDLLVWASAEHGTQPYGRNHYWIHLVAVLCVALDAGVGDWDTLAACICHDLLEDTQISPQLLEEMTNERVRHLVEQVTFDPKMPKAEQMRDLIKRAETMTPRAAVVKCCDTLANIQSLGSGFTPREIRKHKWMKTLPDRDRFAEILVDRFMKTQRKGRVMELMALGLALEIRVHIDSRGKTDA